MILPCFMPAKCHCSSLHENPAVIPVSMSFATQAAVEAFEVGSSNTDQLPEGKEADGIIGDFLSLIHI